MYSMLNDIQEMLWLVVHVNKFNGIICMYVFRIDLYSGKACMCEWVNVYKLTKVSECKIYVAVEIAYVLDEW